MTDEDTHNERLADAQPMSIPEYAERDADGEAVIPDDDGVEPVERNVRESRDKIRYKCNLVRGTDTRNQDKHDIKARGETPAQVAYRTQRVIEELKDRGVFQEIRDIQPEVSGGGDDE